MNEITDVILSNFYGLLNSWDTLEQILGDLYNTWAVILGLTVLSLGKYLHLYYSFTLVRNSFVLVISLVTVSILHLLAHLVSYIIMILVSIASVVGTGFLWYTYIDIKYNLDHTRKHMLLLESVRNETAFFWYSIVATVITVRARRFLIVLIRTDFVGDNFNSGDRPP